MWKWIVGAVTALVVGVVGLGLYLGDKIYPRFPHRHIAEADFARTYAPAQLRADFVYLTSTVEHIHPDIGAITDPATYARDKARTLAALDHPMTRTEFWRVLAPFTGHSYNEGHTEIIGLTEERTAYEAHGGTYPPLTVKVEPGKLSVDRPLSGAAIAPGASIVSINGVDAARLSAWLIGTEATETLGGREVWAARHFPRGLFALGLRPPFRIAYVAPGAAGPAVLDTPGIGFDAWNKQASGGLEQPLYLTIDHGVAHLAVRDFDLPFDQYKGLLKAAFQKIHDARVTAVVLDLSQNTGGDTRQSDELQAYLSDAKLPAMREVEVKATPEVKAMYRTLLPEGFRWIPLNSLIPMLRGIQQAPDNGVYRFHPEGTAPSKRTFPKALAWHGDLYLLISPMTYSTALIAADPYWYWKRATVVGEPTQEGLTFFGDYYEFDLPNSAIQMHVSHKAFKLFGSTGPHSQIVPQYRTSPAHPDAYRYALDLIAAKARGGTAAR